MTPSPGPAVVEAGRRRRALPAPPHVVAESLREPDRDPARPWLHLLPDEQRPRVAETGPGLVVWSSPWPAQPEALVRFELVVGRDGGTDLTWTLLVAELPDRSRLGHYRRRINELVHRDLRYSYGQ